MTEAGGGDPPEGGFREVRVSLPYYLIRFEGRDYLLDAYFMQSVTCLARRALMIYPPKAGKSGLPRVPEVKPAYTLNDALGMIREAYFWVAEERLKRARQTLAKFRLSFIVPVGLFRRYGRADAQLDSELAGALYLLEGVFGKHSLIKGIKPERHSLSRVDVILSYYSEDDELEVKSINNSISRAYRWLFANDERFKEDLLTLLRRVCRGGDSPASPKR